MGVGRVGIVHARAYLDNPAVDFVGICDVDRELADEQARRRHLHIEDTGEAPQTGGWPFWFGRGI